MEMAGSRYASIFQKICAIALIDSQGKNEQALSSEVELGNVIRSQIKVREETVDVTGL